MKGTRTKRGVDESIREKEKKKIINKTSTLVLRLALSAPRVQREVGVVVKESAVF